MDESFKEVVGFIKQDERKLQTEALSLTTLVPG